MFHPGVVAIAATFRRTLPDSDGQFFGDRRVARPGRRQPPPGQPRLPGDDRLPDSLRRHRRRDRNRSRRLPYPATPLAGVEPVTTPVGGLLVYTAAARRIPGSRATDRRNHRPDQRPRNPRSLHHCRPDLRPLAAAHGHCRHGHRPCRGHRSLSQRLPTFALRMSVPCTN